MATEKKKRRSEKVSEFMAAFPEREVRLPGGQRVRMKPLPLDLFPEVVLAFLRLAAAASDGVSPVGLMGLMGRELLEMIDHCLVDGAEVKNLGISAAPALIQTFLDQNLQEEALKNWSSLLASHGGTLAGLFPTLGSLLPKASPPSRSPSPAPSTPEAPSGGSE